MSPDILKTGIVAKRIALVLAVLACALVITGCSRSGGQAVQASQTQPGPAVEPAATAENGAPATAADQSVPKIPAGTAVSVRLLTTISSGSAHVGEEYDGELSAPVVVDGRTLFNKSARAHILVVSAQASGGLQHPGFLRITLDSIQGPRGNWIQIGTAPLSIKGQSHKKRNTTIIGGASAAGAAIGAIAGGGKGAAIGAISGAGAGTAGAYATGRKDIAYSAETVLRFRTTADSTMNQ